MAVYYKFKSAKDFDSINIEGHFISVLNLKEKIFESKHLGRGTDFDLMVSNAQTDEEYLDEEMLIPKNTSVLVRRVPGRPRMPIVTQREETKVVENKVDDVQPAKSSFSVPESSSMRYPEEADWGEFGDDLYATIPEMLPQIQSSVPMQDAPPPSRADEDSKIKALIDTPALDWNRQPQDVFNAGRGFGRGMGGRMMAGRGFGRGMFERKTLPPGYICHRCKVAGHLIQHCPTNGDPNFDIKRVKPPTGIPKSMLMATPDGSYALPSGAVAVLKPNEAAFDKEVEGLPSTRSLNDIPSELRCPLCKEVMKDAVLTSKCCFNSFCDKCIRDLMISKSQCVCGATNVLADDLLPNKALRKTINHMLESNSNSSGGNAGSMLQIQDMESARSAPPKPSSPTLSANSKGQQMAPHRDDHNHDLKDTADEKAHVANVPQQSLEIARAVKPTDISEATFDSMTLKEQTSQGSAPLAEEEVQKSSACDPGKKKKKKKLRLPNGPEMQWRPQDFPSDYMTPFAPPSNYNPYWSGMQPGMEGFLNPYGMMPQMGYMPGPFDAPLGGMFPHDPFAGQGYMMPHINPQRDLSELAMGSNPARPIMSREEFEARKADLRRKRENEQMGRREIFKERDEREMGNAGSDVSSMRSKHQRPVPPGPSPNFGPYGNPNQRTGRAISPERSHYSSQQRDRDHHREERGAYHHREEAGVEKHRLSRETESGRTIKRRSDYEELARETEHVRLGKRRAEDESSGRHTKRRAEHEDHHHSRKRRSVEHYTKEEEVAVVVEGVDGDADEEKNKLKGSVFSRISFPVEKKKKAKDVVKDPSPSLPPTAPTSNGKQTLMMYDQESSDDERHFKRRPSRYQSSPPPQPMEEDARPSRRPKERNSGEYERERVSHKHHHR
ncbi:hypothetical protein GIB67_028990 [Kingdonia uniflora]|uniref:DWNN domain-containing protein n=1 Tax=Kingdonia uniflora TaxID=39325 RepID=A0A7J7N693_9MAGN|nr:hypothetical protein GIB67_028990 [Kingdonia uniflora]